MKRAVEQAIEEIRQSLTGSAVLAEPDTAGGAYVTVQTVELGPTFEPSTSFIGFHITFQYPHADVYPHFIAAGLRRKDGKALGAAIHVDKEWVTPSQKLKATMVSRRSNKLNAAVDTAATKLQKVLEWIRSQ